MRIRSRDCPLRRLADASPLALEVWMLRRVVVGVLGLLLVVTVFDAAGFSTRSGASRPSAPSSVPGGSSASSAVPSFAVSSGAGTSPEFPGDADPAAVYAFMIPNGLVISWAPYTSTDAVTERLIVQFGDVVDAIVEAWSAGDVRDPRFTAWCLLGCGQVFGALIAPWAAAQQSPAGTLRLYHEFAEVSRAGTTGVVSVCVDDSGLTAHTTSDVTVSATRKRGAVLYVFALDYDATAGHWIALEAYNSAGSPVCTGGGS